MARVASWVARPIVSLDTAFMTAIWVGSGHVGNGLDARPGVPHSAGREPRPGVPGFRFAPAGRTGDPCTLAYSWCNRSRLMS